MSRRLARMIVRVDAGLHETLTTLAARLFNETRLEYPHASVVRGLLSKLSPGSPRLSTRFFPSTTTTFPHLPPCRMLFA